MRQGISAKRFCQPALTIAFVIGC